MESLRNNNNNNNNNINDDTTTLSSQTKRSLEYYGNDLSTTTTRSSRIVRPEGDEEESYRACKRPRTERFLEAAETFENIRETCQFFEQGLSAIVSSSSGGQLENDDDDYDDDDSADDEDNANGASTSTTAALYESVRKQLSQHEEVFRAQCAIWKADADEAIQLHQSFYCVVNAINNNNNNNKSKSTTSDLTLLNQGPETNLVITNMIAEFAGVESKADIADWMELRALL